MSKQIIILWDPSQSDDVEKQELRLQIGEGVQARAFGPVQLNRFTSQWSTKETGEPLQEGTTINVSIVAVDTSGLRSTPLEGSFSIPAVPPDGPSNLSFEVRDFDDDGGPIGPTGPVG